MLGGEVTSGLSVVESSFELNSTSLLPFKRLDFTI